MMGLAKQREVVRHDVGDDHHEGSDQELTSNEPTSNELAKNEPAKNPDVTQDNVTQDNELVEGENMTGDDQGEQPEQRPEELRLIEALLFAAGEPLDNKTLAGRLPEGVDIDAAMRRLQAEYAPRGVNLVRVAGKWMFRTANDLAWLLARDTVEPKKLSRAANETLAIIAYHQPVTRAEIEDIRGVSVSKGTLDVLMETGWVRPRGRRKAPGRPLTFGTTETFLSHFGLEAIGDLPGLDELKGTGLLDGRLPPGFSIPLPSDDTSLRDDEDPLEPGDLDLGLAPRPTPSED
ncbi:MAG: segregation and condensation protein [Hyphomicrobiales bacterium]|jgi:segregation and condensation protein B